MVVIDASIVLGWYFGDEQPGASVPALLESFVHDETRLIAPTILEYEVLNGLLTASRRGRLGLETARLSWRGFKELGIELIDIEENGDNILQAAETAGLSAYDGAYLALAIKEKAELATADKSLSVAAKNAKVRLVGAH